MSSTDYELRRETEAAKQLLASLRDQGVDDDAELVADAIEGETSLNEALAEAIEQDDIDDALEIGLKAVIERFKSRLSMIQNRRERRKALIEKAMMETDQTKVKLACATLSISKRAPGLVITSEADIPSRFFVEQPRPAPKLDRAKLKEALAANENIPGATLDNGSVSLTIRRR